MELAIDGLTEAMIGIVVIREVDRALEKYPVWVHPFAGLSFSRARRLYGQAHGDGRIFISRQFIGTNALTDLEDTVRHELAHLIVGLKWRHGPKWKRVAADLGARPRASGRSEDAMLEDRLSDAPYLLMAVLRDGSEREIKPAYRRLRSYLDYRYSRFGKRYRIGKDYVERFYYAQR